MNNFKTVKRKTVEAESEGSQTVPVPEKVPIIDAIEFVGVNKFHYLLVAFCFAVHMSVISETNVTGYVMTTADKELGLSSNDQGILAAMAFSGMVASALFWGIAMDIGGRHLTLSVALTCDAFVGTVSSIAATYHFLAFARFLTGFFIQGSITSALTCVGEYLPPAYRSKGIIIFGAAPGVANMFLAATAAIVHGFVLKIVFPWGFSFDSWRILLLCTSITPFVLVILLEYFPETPMYLVRQRKTEEGLAAMQRIWALGSKRPPTEFPVLYFRYMLFSERRAFGTLNLKATKKAIKEIVMPPEEEKRNFLQSSCHNLRSLFISKNVRKTVILCFISFSVLTGYNGILIWIPEILKRINSFETDYTGQLVTACDAMQDRSPIDVTPTPMVKFHEEFPEEVDLKSYLITLLVGACVLVFSMIGCYVIGFIGNKLALSILLLIDSGLVIGLAYVPGGLKGFVAMISFLIPFGVLSLSTYSAMALELYETEIRGMAINIVMMFGRLGATISNFIFGYFMETRCHSCFLYVAVLLCISAVLSTFLQASRPSRPHILLLKRKHRDPENTS